MNVPPWLRSRRAACPKCPHASRRELRGRRVVTLADTCQLAGRTIRQVYESPDFICPAGRFARGVIQPGDVGGRLTIEGKAITGWAPRSGAGAKIIVPGASVDPGCGGCRDERLRPT